MHGSQGVINPHACEGPGNALFSLLFGKAKVSGAEGDVLPYGISKELIIGTLAYQPHHAWTHALVPQQYRACVRSQRARQDACRRGLACSGRATEQRQLSGRDLKREM